MKIKSECLELNKKTIRELVGLVGGVAHLARMTKLPYHNIYGWLRNGQISREGLRVIMQNNELCKLVNVNNLRSDLSLNEGKNES